MNPDTLDTVRTAGIGTAGVTWSIFGMPFAEVAALGTAIYVVLKIILILPDLKKKYWDKK